MKLRFSMVTGVALIAIALLGFRCVGDDLRHSGEFFAVTGILVSGVALYGSGRFPRLAAHLSLAWVPVGIGAGMLIGAIIDEEVIGVCTGLSCGLLLARIFRRRMCPSSRTLA